MRKRYASRVMVGIFRAWKVRVDEGVESAAREADVSVFHIGRWSTAAVGDDGCPRKGSEDDEAWSRLSFVAAICVSNEARSLSNSGEG